jgi:hypothetical protein
VIILIPILAGIGYIINATRADDQKWQHKSIWGVATAIGLVMFVAAIANYTTTAY